MKSRLINELLLRQKSINEYYRAGKSIIITPSLGPPNRPLIINALIQTRPPKNQAGVLENLAVVLIILPLL